MSKKNEKKQKITQLPLVLTRSPFLYIPPEIMAKLEAYIFLAKGEISGLGTVERYGERDFLVTGVYLLKQKCKASETMLDPDGLAQFAYELVRNGGNMSGLKLWWHSHANFAVSWSQDDERTIQGFQNEWMLSIVGNKLGEMLARVDVFSPVRVTDRNLLARVYRPLDEGQMKEVEAEIAEKVTFETPKPTVYHYSYPPVPQQPLLPAEIGGDGEEWENGLSYE